MTDAQQEALANTQIETKQVDGDILCVSCAYNLRGLAEDGKCPECSTTILRSIQKDALHFSCPQWLVRVHFGVSLAGFGIAAAFFLMASTFALFFITLALDFHIIDFILLPLMMLLHLALLTFLAGCWIACTKEPRPENDHSNNMSRQVVRFLSLAILPTLFISSYFLSQSQQSSGQHAQSLMILERLVSFLLFEMCVGLAMAASIVMNQLLSRSLNPPRLITRRFQVWALLLGVLFAIKTSAYLMQQITGVAKYLGRQSALGSLIETIIIFGSAYLTITLARRLFELRSAIRESLTAARIIN